MNVHEINYLTFSGGGGKGTAYLGAVKVLEEMGLLPIDIRKTDKQIKGLSGSSAGALMSYLLNLGYCTESADVKAPSLIELFRITDFDKFYDPAENGKIRSLNNTSFEKVDFNAKHTAGTISKRNKDLDYFPLTWDIVENISLVTFAKTILALRLLSSKFIAENIAPLPSVLTSIGGSVKDFVKDATLGLDGDVKDFIKGIGEELGFATADILVLYLSRHTIYLKLNEYVINGTLKDSLEKLQTTTPEYSTIISLFLKNKKKYLYNLLYDRGLFSGFEIRKFLIRRLAEFIIRNNLEEAYLVKNYKTINEIPEIALNIIANQFTFKRLYEITGVKLVVTGSNITTKKLMLFSVDTTPEFPVVEAVGISMNFPFGFKPIFIQNNPRKELNGLWVDGGLINNLPANVFYDKRGNLEKMTLIFNLSPGHGLTPKSYFENFVKLFKGNSVDTRDILSSKDANPYETLLKHISEVLISSNYYVESGQVEYPFNLEDHVIDILSFDLSTLEFSPYAETALPPIAMAYFSTTQKLRGDKYESALKNLKNNKPFFEAIDSKFKKLKLENPELESNRNEFIRKKKEYRYFKMLIGMSGNTSR